MSNTVPIELSIFRLLKILAIGTGRMLWKQLSKSWSPSIMWMKQGAPKGKVVLSYSMSSLVKVLKEYM